MTRWITKADTWLIAILLTLSLASICLNVYAFRANAEQSAEIWVDGSLLKRVPLKVGYRQEFRVGSHTEYDIIQVEGTRIRVREADCPEQICVLTGWVNKAPQQIVCLPHRMVIQIVSNTTELDTIAH